MVDSESFSYIANSTRARIFFAFLFTDGSQCLG